MTTQASAAPQQFRRGGKATLNEQPDGYLSKGYPVTVGKTYEVLDFMGSCLVVSTDVPGQTASIYRGRFTPVH